MTHVSFRPLWRASSRGKPTRVAARLAIPTLFLALFAATPANAALSWSGYPITSSSIVVSVIRTDLAVAAVFRPALSAGAPAKIGRLAADLCGVPPASTGLFELCYPQFSASLKARFPQADLQAIADQSLIASLDAPAAPGRYPLVMLMGSASGRGLDLLALAESIASHGHVVAVVAPAEPLHQPPIDAALLDSLREAHRDILSVLASDPNVDATRLAVGGWSIGGAPGLLTAMNDPRVKVVISLDDALVYAYGVELIAAAADYRPEAFRGDILIVRAGVKNAVPQSEALLTALTNVQVRTVTAPSHRHGDFSDQLGVLPALSAPPEDRAAFQEAVARIGTQIIDFLAEHLAD